MPSAPPIRNATRPLPRAPQRSSRVASSLLEGAETVAIAGLADDEAARALGRAAVAAAGPETIVWLDPARPAPDGPLAYVCHGTSCLPPVGDEASLRKLLTQA